MADQAQATKNLEFCKFFIFNELPTFLGIFSEIFFVVDFWGQGFSGCFVDFLCGVLCLWVSLLEF